MTNLNPDQFGAVMHSPVWEDHNIGVDDEMPYFHGTTPEAADRIADSGFSLAHQSNGRSGGEGVYLHHQEHRTHEYGPTTVAVSLPGHLRIHQNPYGDQMAYNWAAARRDEHGGELEDHLPTVLHVMGYHGHMDPDDHATVVYDPKNVHYLTHYDPAKNGR